MKLKPLGDRVIIKAVDQEQVTASGLVLPDTAKERPQRGKVLAVGEGRWGEDGARVPLEVQEGDEIIYAKYGGTEIKLDGDDVLILQEHDILATVTGSPAKAEAPAKKPRAASTRKTAAKK
ncbi:MAG: chaperonin GroES [Miltoncostaeaceae bacterium]|jgi:chaperonin GroES|nr:chaperonin GroES [Miltoncostaeaceae bacterium]